MKIGVKMSADTEAFIKQLGSFSRKLHRELIQTADILGALLVGWTRDTIDAQGFKELSKAYKDWKISCGYDSRILLLSHAMYDAISYKRMSSSMTLISGQIGFKAGGMHNHWSSSSKHPTGDKITNRSKKGRYSPWSPGTKSGSTSVGTWLLATWHEEGRGRNPARPFFEPTAKGHKKDVYDHFLAAVVRAWGGK
jgi:hypothetical protein